MPGQMLKNRIPSCLYWALNLAVTMFVAALLMAYRGLSEMS